MSFSISQLTAKQVSWLTTMAIVSLSTTNITELSTTQAAALTASQINAMETTDSDVNGADWSAVGQRLAPDAHAQVPGADRYPDDRTDRHPGRGSHGIRDRRADLDRNSGFATTQADALTSRQLGGLTATALANFSTTQIGALSSTQLQGLTTTQINSLTTARLKSWIWESFRSFSFAPERHGHRQSDRDPARMADDVADRPTDDRADRCADLDRDPGFHNNASQCPDGPAARRADQHRARQFLDHADRRAQHQPGSGPDRSAAQRAARRCARRHQSGQTLALQLRVLSTTAIDRLTETQVPA